jgi:hypothetical protein
MDQTDGHAVQVVQLLATLQSGDHQSSFLEYAEVNRRRPWIERFIGARALSSSEHV